MRKIRLFAGVLVVLGLILGIQVSSAVAQAPVIDSITPDYGSTLSPTNVTITGSNFEQGANVSLFPGGPYIIGSVGTTARDVYFSGNYAYVAAIEGYSGGGFLKVIDISTPSSPAIIGSVDIPGSARDVYFSGDYAYVVAVVGLGGMSTLLKVIDISIPSSPVIIGSVDTPSHANAVYVSGNYAYVADRDSGLQVIDISIPYGPSIHSVLLESNVGNSTTITSAIPANLPDGYYHIMVSNPNGGGRGMLHMDSGY